MFFSLLYWVPLWLLIIYLGWAFRTVSETENGLILYFGKKRRCVGPGWYFLKPFETIRRFPSNQLPMPIPGLDEVIQKEDQDNIRPGKIAPLRVTHASPKEALFLDIATGKFKRLDKFSPEEQLILNSGPLNKRLTTEVSAIIISRLDPEKLYEFMRNSGSVEKALSTLMEIAKSAINEDLSKVTPSQAMLHKAVFSQRLRLAMEVHVGEKERDLLVPLEKYSTTEHIDEDRHPAPWGWLIDTAEIKNIDPRKHVNTAIAEASAAESQREETILNADAAAEATKRQGAADGQAEKDRGIGKAAAIEAIGKAMALPGAQAAAQLEAAVEIAKAAKLVIAPDVFSTVATGMAQNLPFGKKATE